MVDCQLAPLVPYAPSTESPWDVNAVQHLHRRMGFEVGPDEIALALSQNPVTYITNTLTAAAALAPMDEPVWGRYTISDYNDPSEVAENVIEWRSAWVNDMRDNPWRSKLVLFWHGHFVTGINKYQCPSWMWQYHDVLQRDAFGDFRALVRATGKTPAMLVYLDGVLSSRFDANENYARELFELFTLGEGNGYTQTDITEAARAFTGYNGYTEACAPITFIPATFDPGSKTIFGQTGAYDFDAAVNLVFSERAAECSRYICGKLYAHYVSAQVDADVVEQLATTFRDSDWSIVAVLEQLITSEHFFSPALRGTRVKNPFEYVLGTEQLLASTALRTPELTNAVAFVAGNMGQILFDPPDVAGWPGDRSWINGNTLSVRFEGAEQLAYLIYLDDREALATWAKALNPASEFNVTDVTRAIVDFVLPQGLPTPAEYEQAEIAMRGEVPSYYFDSGLWSLDFEYAPEQVATLLVYLLRRPEYQLC